MLSGIAALVLGALPSTTNAQSAEEAIKGRHIGVARNRATTAPRSEGDQSLVDGWPMYRSERGQAAFNDTMATLAASEGPAPKADAFKGCQNLECTLTLPAMSAEGWVPAGRIWVSPESYVLFSHSPRKTMGRRGGMLRRHAHKGMRYFVYHEFHNGTRNTDTYDTISSHSGPVFVPFYMSKQATDAKGRRFVTIVQVAPYDVVSIHASNTGSSGPGIEVAKNVNETLEPLQAEAGVVIGQIIKTAAPHLRVVNHRGTEGQPMLQAYERHVRASGQRGNAQRVTLPFTPAATQKIDVASAGLGDLIVRRGVSPRIPIAERGIIAPKQMAAASAAAPVSPTRSDANATASDLSPLAAYLKANLARMKRMPEFARVIPQTVTSLSDEGPAESVVHLLDANRQVLGRIEAYREGGKLIKGRYVYVPLDRDSEDEPPFELDLSKPIAQRQASR